MFRALSYICTVAAVLFSSVNFELLAQLSNAVESPKDAEWTQISSCVFDWDNYGRASIITEIPSEWYDPGDFTRIRIIMQDQDQEKDQDEFILDGDGWVKYTTEDASLLPEIKETNLVESDCVLANKITDNKTVLFLFGYAYSTGPGSLDVLDISESGHLRVLLHLDEFLFTDLRDLDGDGLAELIGIKCYTQEYGYGFLTYNPFNVYKLEHTSYSNMTLSLPLSESYNLKHYYGWAGPRCSENIAVVLHPPQGDKPVIVTDEEAMKMMEQALDSGATPGK